MRRHKRRLMDLHLYTRAAVLLPLLEDKPGSWHILFEVRSHSLKGQPDDICFPGGRVDGADASALETALRETCEELGVNRSSIEVLGELDIMITPFRVLLYPFVGLLHEPGQIKHNKKEVAETFTVALDRLLEIVPEYHEIPVHSQPLDDFPFDKIAGGKNYPWRTGILPEYFYEVEGRAIWGLTGRVLTNFLSIVKPTAHDDNPDCQDSLTRALESSAKGQG